MMENVILMGHAGKRTVDDASNFLKRIYLVEREMMRTLGGYLISVRNWTMKKEIPFHIWRDSIRADGLRTRILEMRYPRRDVDQNHDEKLLAFLSLPIRSVIDAELLLSVYTVAKRAVYEAYLDYLKDADPLDDAPSVVLIRGFLPELEQQLKDAEGWFERLPEGERQTSAAWGHSLARHLGIIGGVRGAEPTDEPVPSTDRAEYAPPVKPARDHHFGDAVYHMPKQFFQTDYERKFIERQVWQGINHVNEIWASEITGLVLWSWKDMPWEFYLDCARWCFDESRHCKMGEERLSAWGFEAGVDYPVYGDHYVSQSEHGELATLTLLHRFEKNGPNWKSGLMREFSEVGDTSSSQDFDYDWADESIHLLYGHKWTLYKLGGDLDALDDLIEEVYDRWLAWLAESHRSWDYEPYASRIQQKIQEVEMRYRV